MQAHIINLFLLMFSTVQPTDSTINYLNTPSKLIFNHDSFIFSWSSHPNESYYKQEYLPSGQNLAQYQDMLFVDFLDTEMSPKDVVSYQITQLQDRKKYDNVCNYQVVKKKNGDEYILDFVLSEAQGTKIKMIEWSGYRYIPYADAAGHKGVLLIGLTHHAYGDRSTIFLKNLKDFRPQVLQALSTWDTPELKIK